MMINPNQGNYFQQTGETVRAILSEHLDTFAAVGFDAETGMPMLVVNVHQSPVEIIALKSMLSDCQKTLDKIMESIASGILTKKSNHDGGEFPLEGVNQ